MASWLDVDQTTSPTRVLKNAPIHHSIRVPSRKAAVKISPNLKTFNQVSSTSGTNKSLVELARIVDIVVWKRLKEAKVAWTSKDTLHPNFYSPIFATEDGIEVLCSPKFNRCKSSTCV